MAKSESGEPLDSKNDKSLALDFVTLKKKQKQKPSTQLYEWTYALLFIGEKK